MDQTNQNNQGIPTPPPTPSNDEFKVFAILGYIFEILFFLPLVMENGKKNQFAMFHANQQLLLLITFIIGGLLSIVFIGFFVVIFGVICKILGIINAARGEMKPLPLIGHITLLK